jgi:hypothetical protein
MVSKTPHSGLDPNIDQLWRIYAKVLTLLRVKFDVENVPVLDYLLEEDEQTLGFAPFDNDDTIRRYKGDDGNAKPRCPQNRRPANIEMLFRIAEFVLDGIFLVVKKVRLIPGCPFVIELFSNRWGRGYTFCVSRGWIAGFFRNQHRIRQRGRIQPDGGGHGQLRTGREWYR